MLRPAPSLTANFRRTPDTFADCAPHCPLLFNLTADVAESRPLDPAEPGYAAGMELVETAIAAYKASLAADMRSHPDMRSDLTTKICCNPDNIVCRCEEI